MKTAGRNGTPRRRHAHARRRRRLGQRASEQISSDPFTNSTSQHPTEVEPDTFAFGTTIVAAFQVGRFFDGGASDIGWATSTDGGATVDAGLPARASPRSSAAARSTASATRASPIDARHNVWLISSLAAAAPPSRRRRSS